MLTVTLTSCYNGFYNKTNCVCFFIVKTQKYFDLGDLSIASKHVTGAPNENIVQNHLNVALLNVF